jgi:pyruvate dehydrogenase E2 component (dihydrolipoamide acetyltransferase)
MAVRIDMPKLSDTMEEGVIAKWNVSEGDKVSSGDIIAEVETDKATMDVEVFDDGTILKLMAEEGEGIPLGEPIAIIGEEGEDISDLLSEVGGESSSSEPASTSKNGQDKESYDPVFGDLEEGDEKQSAAASDANGRIKASPLARNMAQDRGIDLANVDGSGPQGRIIKRDIENYQPVEAPTQAPAADVEATVAAAPETDTSEDVRVSQMRKTIARRLAESKYSSPHFYETIDIDMEDAIAARKQLNEISEVKISFNDLVTKAAAVALTQHQDVNSSWLGDKIRKHGQVHVAVAVAIDEGLVTPVIRHTDKKGLSQISKETKALAEKARNRDLQPEEMEGSTFTISNLGMFGIEEFTAIINPPNACIMAVGAIRDVPVVKDGEVVPGKRMKVTLSSDHRIVDGAKAAEFLNTFKDLLENPMGMLL